MNEHNKSRSIKKFWDLLLFLAILAVFFGCGNDINGTAAIRQEVDGLQIEQFIDSQSEGYKTVTHYQTKSINSFPARIFLASLHDVLCLVKSEPVTQAPLPSFGQRIVAFLAKKQICHKDSDKPHLFSC
jgi:hypothetical protein